MSIDFQSIIGMLEGLGPFGRWVAVSLGFLGAVYAAFWLVSGIWDKGGRALFQAASRCLSGLNTQALPDLPVDPSYVLTKDYDAALIGEIRGNDRLHQHFLRVTDRGSAPAILRLPWKLSPNKTWRYLGPDTNRRAPPEALTDRDALKRLVDTGLVQPFADLSDFKSGEWGYQATPEAYRLREVYDGQDGEDK